MAHSISIHKVTSVRLEHIGKGAAKNVHEYYVRKIRIQTKNGQFDITLFADGDEGALVFEEAPEEAGKETA